MAQPVTTLVTYRPKKGKEAELEALVVRHWRVLDQVGLVTQEPVRLWRATDKRSGEIHFVEMFQWKDPEASGKAHHTPEVLALWEAMGPVLEELKLSTIESLAVAAP